MFRLSQFVRELCAPTTAAGGEAHDASEGAPKGPPENPPKGPVVIWNLIRRCNLVCKHCYSISADKDFPGELATDQVFRVLDDLKAFGVPALILSGGEPLLRPDIFVIALRAKGMGFFVGLSTNGTLIDEDRIGTVAEAGFDYVGISLDGIAATHDRFRRRDGAFAASLGAARLCRDRGLKVGIRFTITRDNAHDLVPMLDLLDAEGIDRFYFSHLNYAGRGNHNRRDDAAFAMTRSAMVTLFERCLAGERRDQSKEFVTGNNDADGPFLLMWVRRRFPERAQHVESRLRQWGGNASGVNVANIDNLGNVHPDTMWWHHTLGNVNQRPFSQIWSDTSDPLMAGLKRRLRPVKGRCAACRYLAICGGNTRVRAHQVTGDPWAEDPGCYLTDEEIGVAAQPRVAVTSFGHDRLVRTQ